MSAISVVLADDELLLREAIMTLLCLNDDIEVVGTAQDGKEAIEVITRLRPDIAVLDLEMPKLDGLEVAAAILEASKNTRVVFLTTIARAAGFRRARSIGVLAFVTKATSVKELPHILRTVHAGGRYVDGSVAASALSESDCPLTTREIDVLREALDGATISVIAERTHLAQGTVRNYLSSAMAKLGAPTRVSAAKIAWREGWI